MFILWGPLTKIHHAFIMSGLDIMDLSLRILVNVEFIIIVRWYQYSLEVNHQG